MSKGARSIEFGEYGTLSKISEKMSTLCNIKFFNRNKDRIPTERVAGSMGVVNFPYSAYSISEYEFFTFSDITFGVLIVGTNF